MWRCKLTFLLMWGRDEQCLNMPYGLGSSGFLCPQIQQEHNNFNAPDPPNAFAGVFMTDCVNLQIRKCL